MFANVKKELVFQTRQIRIRVQARHAIRRRPTALQLYSVCGDFRDMRVPVCAATAERMAARGGVFKVCPEYFPPQICTHLFVVPFLRGAEKVAGAGVQSAPLLEPVQQNLNWIQICNQKEASAASRKPAEVLKANLCCTNPAHSSMDSPRLRLEE